MVEPTNIPPTLLFDGVCNLCNHAVQFVIKRDQKGVVHFAALQSEFGQQQLAKANLSTKELKSLILLENGKIYTHSTGALKLSRYLGMPWSWAYIFIIIPRPIRDLFYNIIANNRYRWFGKKDQCMMPSPELKSRFLDV